jgi:hypothetical protein
MLFHGHCLCGYVRYDIIGPPLRVHYCHCEMCRRATGGPFAVLAWVARESLRWTSHGPAIRRSSPIAERGFCPECGTPLFLSYDGRDDIALTVGTLDDAACWAPTSHYGIESRLPWTDCGQGMRAVKTKESF